MDLKKGSEMTITLSFSNFLLFVITIIFCVIGIYLLITLKKLSRLVEKIDTLVPSVKEILSKSKNVLDRMESLSEEAEEAVRETRMATSRVRGVIEEAATIIEDALFVLKPISVISNAFKTGFSLFQNFFTKNDEDKEE